MRGKVFISSAADAAAGITPAYAGKSAARSIKSNGGWDHPRLCGEKGMTIANRKKLMGSPPPMRGKVIVPLRDLADFRITPAYAGKSCTNSI